MGVETERSSFVGLFKGMGEELYFFCSKAKKTRIITAETISEMVIPKEWVVKHMRMFIKKHRYENPKDDKFSYFYMLKISDILNYYEQNRYK